jgi:30S ribosomal protein S31
MGKGDRKTAKGKRYNSSYGNARSSKVVTKAAGNAAAPVAKKATKTVAKAPVAKKAAVKKAGSKD